MPVHSASMAPALPFVAICALVGLTAPALAAQPIDPKHLALEDCPDLPGCDALVLLDEVELNNESNRSRYSYRRMIKVFTKEGIERYSDVELRTGAGTLALRDLKGRTIQPDGTVVELEQENVHVKYLKQGKRRVKIRSAKFPGVVPGAILEHSFDFVSDPFVILTSDTWLLQESVPVLKGKYTLKAGKYSFRAVRAGEQTSLIRESSPFKGIAVFEAENVPPLPDEPWSPATWPLRTRLYFGLPDVQSVWLGSYAAKVSDYAGGFMDKGAGVAEKVAELTAPADSPLEKVKKIYRFVNETMASEEARAETAEESALKEAENAGDVLARGFGSEYERTLLFLAMVKKAGLEHGLLLLAGRFSSQFNKESPDEDQFDSFAAAVKTGTGWTFYDPAARYCPFGMISAEKEGGAPNGIMVMPMKGAAVKREGNVNGLIVSTITPTPYSIVSVPHSAAARNVLLRDAKVIVEPDGSLQVESTEKGTGLVDLRHRETYVELDDETRRKTLLEAIRGRLPQSELITAEFQKLTSFDEVAVISYTVKVPGTTGADAGRIVLNPSIYGAFVANPFTSPTRRTPVVLRHAQKTQDRIRFELPQGYDLEELPAPAVFKDPPFSFSLAYGIEDDGLILRRVVEVGAASWPAADYARLKAFYEKLQEADKQAIVLVKKG